MTIESNGSGGWVKNPWVWVGVGAAVLAAILFIVFTGGDGEDEAAAPTTTTEAPTTTTTEAPTTTTTTAPPVVEVAPTAVKGLLDAYNDGGADLFPPGSVEADWYQWDGFHVVLYRGWDPTSGQPICTGNSIFDGSGWQFVTNAPYNGTMDGVCSGANEAAPDRGVPACGSLLYYLTAIPIDQDGAELYGSPEFNDGVTDWMGQTSQAALDVAGTPEFQPDSSGYTLPPSQYDDLTTVTCDVWTDPDLGRPPPDRVVACVASEVRECRNRVGGWVTVARGVMLSRQIEHSSPTSHSRSPMSSSPTTTAGLRLCIVNGYPKASRENFDRSDVGHPHDLFQDFLRREAPNATSVIVYVADPDFSLPEGTGIDDFDGFIWTGSDLTVYHTDDPRVSGQLVFAAELMEAGAISWGSCWGIQMAAQVLGGEVAVNPNGREWGLARRIELSDAGLSSPMLVGKPPIFDGFIMHLDEITRLPEGTVSLGGNEHTSIQAAIFESGDSSYWATQYHPEYNLYEMGRLIAARAEALVSEGHFPDEESVASYATDMMALHADPGSRELREKLDVGDDIIDPQIRELELRNWLRFVESRS